MTIQDTTWLSPVVVLSFHTFIISVACFTQIPQFLSVLCEIVELCENCGTHTDIWYQSHNKVFLWSGRAFFGMECLVGSHGSFVLRICILLWCIHSTYQNAPKFHNFPQFPQFLQLQKLQISFRTQISLVIHCVHHQNISGLIIHIISSKKVDSAKNEKYEFTNIPVFSNKFHN